MFLTGQIQRPVWIKMLQNNAENECSILQKSTIPFRKLITLVGGKIYARYLDAMKLDRLTN